MCVYNRALFLSKILAIEENMATPRSYVQPCGIMNWGMAIVLSLYIFLGFFGYWKYGDDALGSITLNIPQTEVYVWVYIYGVL